MEKLTILVVDDESINIQIISEILTDVYNIKIAKNGKSGYEAYAKYSPALIISDINMPIMNGIEMVSKIRQKDQNTKVIFTTSHSDLDYLLQSSSLKLIKYILKPIKREELLEAVNIAVEELQKYKIVSSHILQLDKEYVWDFKTLNLMKSDQAISLTPTERKILNYLFSNVSSMVTYDDILYEAWEDYDMPSKQTLKTMITNLRKKIPENIIHNIYGIGYKILTTP
jgi:DNA-binding response OmpR family regulator